MKRPPARERELKDVLPLNLWRKLARQEITTVEQVKQLYPEKLWKMHYVGPVSFRQLEQHLFPGKRYEPSAHESPGAGLLEDSSIEELLPLRVIALLKRHRIETLRQFEAAYPTRLKEIPGIGKIARQEVEKSITVQHQLGKPLPIADD